MVVQIAALCSFPNLSDPKDELTVIKEETIVAKRLERLYQVVIYAGTRAGAIASNLERAAKSAGDL